MRCTFAQPPRRRMRETAPRLLLAEPLTAAAFAPFGTVIAWADALTAVPINGGTSVRLDLLPRLPLTAAGGAPALAVFRAQPRAFPLPIVELERHRHGAQLFIPLGRLRFAVVVAAADAALTPAALRAFISNGQQGICLAPGTWHHALLAVDGGDFVVIERRAGEADCEVAQLVTDTHWAPELSLG